MKLFLPLFLTVPGSNKSGLQARAHLPDVCLANQNQSFRFVSLTSALEAFVSEDILCRSYLRVYLHSRRQPVPYPGGRDSWRGHGDSIRTGLAVLLYLLPLFYHLISHLLHSCPFSLPSQTKNGPFKFLLYFVNSCAKRSVFSSSSQFQPFPICRWRQKAIILFQPHTKTHLIYP